MVVCQLVAVSGLTAEVMQKETFYPPKESVEVALREFTQYPKRGSLQGYHDTEELMLATSMRDLYGGIISPATLEARRQQYLKDGIVPDAEWVRYWMSKSDDEIYEMISPENPRALVPNYMQGHPMQDGNYNSLKPIWGKKDQFYSEADGTTWGPGLKVKNPGTGEMVEITDDGTGWLPPEGFKNRQPFRFKAAYRSYQIRKLAYFPYNGEVEFDGPSYRNHASPIYALAYAYAVTRDQKYADRVLMILTRIAENYRHYTSNDDVGAEWSKYIYRAYLDDENFECGILTNLLLSYDLVWDAIPNATKVLEFFARKQGADYNGDRVAEASDLAYNIEKNLFGYAWEFLKRTNQGSLGNMFMRQFRLRTQLALVFRNDNIMEFVLNNPRGFSDIVVGGMHKEGRYYEDTSWYAQLVTNYLLEMAAMIAEYRSEEKFPQGVPLPPAVQSRLAAGRLWEASENNSGRQLGIGDSTVQRTPVFKPTGKPAEDLNGHDVGLTVMRQGGDEASRYNVLLYHGSSGYGHGHLHQLMMKVIAYGYDFSADLGYPANFISPKWQQWTMATLSHPTVTVNERAQNARSTGSLALRGKAPKVQVASAYSSDAYGKTSLYYRTTSVVELKDGRCFVVDIFRVKGGKVHDYSVHSLSGDDGKNFSTTIDSSLKAEQGTLAGRDVPVGAPTKSGASYITDLRVGEAGQAFEATWMTGDAKKIGYRLLVPAGFEGSVITGRAEGEGVVGQSPHDAYLILRRQGDSPLQSTFVTVQQAFQGDAEGLKVEFVKPSLPFSKEQDAVALKVIASDGESFEITSALSGDDQSAEGFAEAWSFRSPDQEYSINWPESGTAPNPIKGTIEEVNYDSGDVIVNSPDDLSKSVGKTIFIHNANYLRTVSNEVTACEKIGSERWRLRLLQDGIFGTSEVASIDGDKKEIVSYVTMDKLRNAPGLAAGKVLIRKADKKLHRIEASDIAPPGLFSTEQRFALNNDALAGFTAGDRYVIYDYGVGDSFSMGREKISNTKDQ